MEYNSPLGKLAWSSAQQIESHLDAGEQIRWIGEPTIPSKPIWLSLLVGIGLAWVVWMLRQFAQVIPLPMQNPAPPANVQQEVLLRLLGLAGQLLVLGIVVYVVWTVCQTVYVITNRRAMICLLAPLPGAGIRSFFPTELQTRRVRRNPNGSGHILLDGGRKLRDDDDFPASVSFLAVAEVNAVDKLLHHLAESRPVSSY